MCEQEAGRLEAELAAWRQKGLNIQWITVMVTGVDGASPPNVDAARAWRDKHHFKSSIVVADPGYVLLPPGSASFGTPSFVIVDPRTQKVQVNQEGISPDPHAIAEALAKKNASAQ